jgi:16S rRNA (cytosine1402-N4)-methyltransferase
MRMDRSEGPTAADLVNHLSERDIADLIYEYGEERRSRQIARAIVRARPLKTTLDLAEVVARAAPRTERIHPATRTFMALRIAVNRELDEVDALLEGMPDLLEPGGRMVVISFHSLEDRRVKQRFQALAREGRAKVLTRHVVTPGAGEVESNPAARSAKLRAIEKL